MCPGSAVEDDWKPDRSFFTTKRLRLKHGELNEDDKAEIPNPLPNFIDPITLEEVVMPAISPAGHVMRSLKFILLTQRGLNLPPALAIPLGCSA
ncbi:hypothetical protein Zmor_027068 [Zophobas morio]|uniref:Uncharacterized protein n=1 Tax=Zophobas morio TaxID=2755281 RepID=A0AA38HL23_9CUCU|nr:hypothetical protein Zmor_027068 [Zophobas morio]